MNVNVMELKIKTAKNMDELDKVVDQFNDLQHEVFVFSIAERQHLTTLLVNRGYNIGRDERG